MITDHCCLYEATRSSMQVVDTPSLWTWINEVLVPGLYDVTWYNGRPFEYDEGFISSREGMMLGMPRLRQIRIRASEWKRSASVLCTNLAGKVNVFHYTLIISISKVKSARLSPVSVV